MAKKAVYEHLKLQNRPYNANDIVSNLDKKFPKTAIQKALDELVESGSVMEKINAKQKIYCCVQESKQDPKELMRLDKELQVHANELEDKLQSLQKKIKEKESAIASLKGGYTMQQLEQMKENLNKSIKSLNKKLDELMTASSAQKDLPTKKRKLEKDLQTYQQEYNKRKRICKDVMECILENYPKSKQHFYEEVGIDIVNV